MHKLNYRTGFIYCSHLKNTFPKHFKYIYGLRVNYRRRLQSRCSCFRDKVTLIFPEPELTIGVWITFENVVTNDKREFRATADLNTTQKTTYDILRELEKADSRFRYEYYFMSDLSLFRISSTSLQSPSSSVVCFFSSIRVASHVYELRIGSS